MLPCKTALFQLLANHQTGFNVEQEEQGHLTWMLVGPTCSLHLAGGNMRHLQQPKPYRARICGPTKINGHSKKKRGKEQFLASSHSDEQSPRALHIHVTTVPLS